VPVHPGRMLIAVDGESVTIDDESGTPERTAPRTVVWAAGVTASSLASRLAELTGAEVDRAGRLTVEPDLTLPGHPEVFALGDMVRVRDTSGASVVLPGVAPVAMQQGRYAARTVRARLRARKGPAVHIWYLIGFQNRLLVIIRWSFSFVTHGRGARLITEAGAQSSAERVPP